MKSYNINCDLSKPVLLNCWKHHAGFIGSKIREYKNSREPDLNKLLKELLQIGESLMDLYLGELAPGKIAEDVMTYLKKQMDLSRNNFQNWLTEEGNDYRIISLEDTSKWTLRLGEKSDRYLHIHPSRYSPHTTRVRSSSLKTAIIYGIIEKQETEDQLSFINRLRKEFFELPPLKNLKSATSLLNLIEILT